MKKMLVISAIAVMLAGCESSHGLFEASWTPVQFGMPGPVMLAVTGKPDNPLPSVYGLLGPITAGADNMVGVGAGLAVGARKCYGVEAGLVTLNQHNYGLAVGGLYNYSENNYAIELGIFNTVLPFLMSASESNNYGLQIGLVNLSANSGVQFGLINGTGPTEEGGIQIGLLNFDNTGIMPLFQLNRAVRTATDEADQGLMTSL